MGHLRDGSHLGHLSALLLGLHEVLVVVLFQVGLHFGVEVAVPDHVEVPLLGYAVLDEPDPVVDLRHLGLDHPDTLEGVVQGYAQADGHLLLDDAARDQVVTPPLLLPLFPPLVTSQRPPQGFAEGRPLLHVQQHVASPDLGLDEQDLFGEEHLFYLGHQITSGEVMDVRQQVVQLQQDLKVFAEGQQ